LLVRPSRSTSDAAAAAFFDVFLAGAPVCESALPAADFDLAPVDLLLKVLEAAFAAFAPVVLDLAIVNLPCFRS
jgi:hypothetical protein